MKRFKSKKWRILSIVVIVFVVSVIAAIWCGSVSRTDGTPLLSTNVIDTSFYDVSYHSDYYPYGGALYTYTYHPKSIFNGKVVIKCKSQSGTKTVAEVDKAYAGDYLAVFDENHLILRRDKTLVVYDIEDKTEHILTEPEEYRFYGENPIACRSDGVYFRRQVEPKNASADGEEANTVYSVLRYSPLTGNEAEIHRYSGGYLTITQEGIWYEKEGKIVFFSFDDNTTTTLDAIDWPKAAISMWSPQFMYSSDYIVRLADSEIDVYDVKTGEIKVVFADNGFLQMGAFMTDKELCFSQWAADVGNWPKYKEADGTYKYTFETGLLEKVSDEECWYLAVLDERTWFAETTFGFLKKIKLLGE